MTPAFAIAIPEEPWLQRLGQLTPPQLVAVCVTVVQAMRALELPVPDRQASTTFFNILAGAGAGKTTVLNVIT